VACENLHLLRSQASADEQKERSLREDQGWTEEDETELKGSRSTRSAGRNKKATTFIAAAPSNNINSSLSGTKQHFYEPNGRMR
jgi:hypothetical protein